MKSNLCRVAILMGIASAALMAASVELKRAEEQIEVIIGGKPFTTYYFHKDIAKPYLMPLRTPSGVIVSRPFPVFNDVSIADRKLPGFEPHQRPLYFDHGDVDGVDFWSETVFTSAYGRSAKQGKQDARSRAHGNMRLANLDEVKEGPDAGVIRARFTLEDPNNRVLAEETQTYTFRGDELRNMIDCEYTIYAGSKCRCFRRSQGGGFRGPAERRPEYAA